MKNTYLNRVHYFSPIPRLRVQQHTVEFVWVGFNLVHYRRSKDPIYLARAGRKRMPYWSEGFKGGSTHAVIPQGVYCYDEKGLCPFWDSDLARPHQSNGYCHYLSEGDWEAEGPTLLWAQCKECGINDDWGNDELL